MANDVSRIIHLEGAANFRDLGGLPTADGRIIRRGRLFRSDVLYRLTDNDTITVRSLGIRTVIDLRSAEEVRTYDESPLNSGGIRHVNIPIIADSSLFTESMVEDNLVLLRHVGDGFRAIFGHLSQDPYPLIINCFAGKDRTGITSALILGALGVPDAEIAADYALSEGHMWRHMHIHRTSDDQVPPDTLPSWLVAAPATMDATLGAIATEWGSVRGYLDAIGVTADELRRISDALVEPATDGGSDSSPTAAQ